MSSDYRYLYCIIPSGSEGIRRVPAVGGLKEHVVYHIKLSYDPLAFRENVIDPYDPLPMAWIAIRRYSGI